MRTFLLVWFGQLVSLISVAAILPRILALPLAYLPDTSSFVGEVTSQMASEGIENRQGDKSAAASLDKA